MAVYPKAIFAKNLRYYMKEKGKTQKELAEIIGVTATTINEWLKARKYPRIDKMELLAKYFNVLKSDLIEENPNAIIHDLYTSEEIGNIVKQKRLEMGLTQSELGQKMGVGKSAVARWESGVVKNLKREKLQEIASILQIPPDTLIGLKHAGKECIIVSQDNFTESQFNQIKNFIKFIKNEK